MTPEVEQFIRDFKSVQYYNHRLINLNLELERLEYRLTWGEKSSVEMTFEQMMSPLPMPSNTMRYMTTTDWDTMADLDVCRADIKRCQDEIRKCVIAEALPQRDLNMMIERYWLNGKPEDVADKYGYSKPGMYKRFNTSLDRLIKVREALRYSQRVDQSTA